MRDGVAYSGPKTVTEFIDRYGLYTRIALTTPEQIQRSCHRLEKKWVTYFNGKEHVTEHKLTPICENTLLPHPQYSPRVKEIPFILRRICGSPFIFEVDKYTKMENYEENFKKFKRIADDPQSRKNMNLGNLYKEMVGGPLPWEMPE